MANDRCTPAAVIIVTLAASIVSAAPGIPGGTLLHLANGDVQGAVSGSTRAFLGIPFAAPPVGALRWRPPVPAAPWQGTLQATAFPPACGQLSSLQSPASDVEDCLYVNVWTPEPAPKRPLPVMVWFHGGGNQQGSSADAVPFPGFTGRFYDGQVLAAERKVVVVTVNYRLNLFGFFAHPALATEDAADPYAGNQGLRDQRAALEWVQANIATFGGNPRRVTIFGESAGAFDVCYQMVSPGSRGLFHRGIGESGGCTTRQLTATEGATRAAGLATAVGCGGGGDELGCLRQVPASTLLAALQTSGGVITNNTFQPVVDGGFIPDQPRSLFDRGAFAKVPYLLGSNSDEGTIFFIGVPPVASEAEYLAALATRYGTRADEVAAHYPAASFATPQQALVRAFGDQILVCPTYDTARRAAAGGAATYLYNFARPIPDPILQAVGLGAFHGSEVVYVFGSITPITGDDARLATTMRAYWGQLAKSGTPNGRGTRKWPRYRATTDRRMNLDVTSAIVRGFRRPECDFWSSVYDAQFGSPSGAFVAP